MKILYILNDFSIGGVEKGLAYLIRQGFFAEANLTVLGLFRGNGSLINELDESKIIGGANFLVNQQKMTVAVLIKAFFLLRRKIRGLSPDIIICSLEQANILARIASIGSKCKFISF